MGGGLPIDLILFGMIALFLVLRLRSILGRRQGFERPADAPARAERGPAGAARVIDAVAEPAPPARVLPEAGSPIGATLTRMQAVDRTFQAQRFLDGAESAFRLIVGAYASGDRLTLRQLLNDDMYTAFETAIATQEQNGEINRTDIRSVQTAEIVAAALSGAMAEIGVRFVSDQVNITIGRDGNPVSGADAVTEITDIWTFQRDLSRPDPAWRLVAARSA